MPLLTATEAGHPSFHVVGPSLPRYAWSRAPSKRGFRSTHYAEARTIHDKPGTFRTYNFISLGYSDSITYSFTLRGQRNISWCTLLFDGQVKDHGHAEGLVMVTSPAEDAHAKGHRVRRSLGITVVTRVVICSHTVVSILIRKWRERTGSSGHSGSGRPLARALSRLLEIRKVYNHAVLRAGWK